MQKSQNGYKCVRILRFFICIILFVAVSYLTCASAYYIAQRITVEVSEDVIRLLHIVLSVLAYHSFFRAFIITDRAARNAFCDSNKDKLRFVFCSFESVCSLVISIVMLCLFSNAFAVGALCDLLEIPHLLAFVIMALLFTTALYITWFDCLFYWANIYDKEQKEKRKRRDVGILAKNVIGFCFAYPTMAYVIPILFPTLRTLPSTLLALCAVVIPLIVVLVVFILSFGYIRAFFIRRKFIKALTKAAKRNGYELSVLKHPYMSLFHDYDECSFTVKAHGKVYSCKFIAGISYGNPMYFEEGGYGRAIRHISLRYRTPIGGPFSRGGLIWHKLPEDLMQFHTEFKYSFDGEGTKVLLICPTPHSIYVLGHGQQKQIDVNDKIWGYTIMTATAFINALERNTVL